MLHNSHFTTFGWFTLTVHRLIVLEHTFLEAPVVGQPPQVALVDVDVGGVAPEPAGAHHPLPHGEAAAAAPDFGDDPRELQSRGELTFGSGTGKG